MKAAWPIGVLAGGAALLGLFALLYYDFPSVYLAVIAGWGEPVFRFPFLDTHAVLAAIECHRIGYDVYVANPCDVLNRPHVYSPLFLEAGILRVTTAYTGAVGIGLALGFLVCVASLPPTRGWRQGTVMVLAILSTMTVFAIERGNNDLLVFIAVTIAGHAMTRTAAARACGYALVMLAAFLKFYPIAAMTVALRERPRYFFATAAVASALLAAFVAHYHGALAETWQVLPTRSTTSGALLGFGAVNLPQGMAQLLTPVLMLDSTTASLAPRLPDLLLALLILSVLWHAAAIVRAAENRERFAGLAPLEATFLVLGASLIVGCFFAGQNVAYRGIFFLFLLPGLGAIARDEKRFGKTAIVVVLLMWGDCLGYWLDALVHVAGLSSSLQYATLTAFWLLLEFVWWRVVATLAGLLLCFAITSEMGRWATDFRVARRVKP